MEEIDKKNPVSTVIGNEYKRKGNKFGEMENNFYYLFMVCNEEKVIFYNMKLFRSQIFKTM
jgi:hypothetical protein